MLVDGDNNMILFLDSIFPHISSLLHTEHGDRE